MANKIRETGWEGISRAGWLELYSTPEVMTDLMMAIFCCLYHASHHMDYAGHVAELLQVEYRALNAAVGWAGGKIRDLCEEEYKKLSPQNKKGNFSLLPPEESMAPWEFVFDGGTDEEGSHLLAMKPAAAEAYREMIYTNPGDEEGLLEILGRDISSYGMQGSLFAATPDQTVRAVKDYLIEKNHFKRKSIEKDSCCLVCGLARKSMLSAVPYGKEEQAERMRGGIFCPTHAALFRAHLISFDGSGNLLVSPLLSEEDRKCMGLVPGNRAKGPFSKRRMAVHRKIFNEEGGKEK